MDKYAKHVLRLRKKSFMDNINVTDEFLDQLYQENLIKKDTIRIINTKSTKLSKINKLIEGLMNCTDVDGFKKFCNLISLDNPTLSKDIENDLLAEKDELLIEDAVTKEAALLVHRHFGSKKRFSERDKKHLKEIIAKKIQVCKEKWKYKFQHMDTQIDDKNNLLTKCNGSLSQMNRKLRHFLRHYHDGLTNHAHGLKTTSDVLKSAPVDTDVLSIFMNNFDTMMSCSVPLINKIQMLQEERERCFVLFSGKTRRNTNHTLLHDEFIINETDTKLKRSKSSIQHTSKYVFENKEKKLDDLISFEIQKRIKEEMEERNREIVDKNNKLTEMSCSLIEKTNSLESSNNRIKELEKQLVERNKTINVLNEHIGEIITSTKYIVNNRYPAYKSDNRNSDLERWVTQAALAQSKMRHDDYSRNYNKNVFSGQSSKIKKKIETLPDSMEKNYKQVYNNDNSTNTHRIDVLNSDIFKQNVPKLYGHNAN
ncbi:hypothetical protein A3Q56_07604 [Intoshia linei]|uniref:CARD domain-containing protein n=1 Tax=Intoshia linei TaxID=1819745 RepID=A0A177ARL4_9BILA|nr:hypothetical protein A3Q56_07604 [Intoshia linei]